MNFTDILGTYAFPIVACIGMAFYVKDVTEKNRQEIKELNEAHKEEMKNLSEALNNNTQAIQELRMLISTFIGGLSNDNK